MSTTPVPTDADLQQRCAEIIEWQRTGVLPGNALRAYAALHWTGHFDSLQMAERDTSAQAMEAIARWGAQPAPAASPAPLTDEQCDAIYEALDSFGREVDHYAFGLPYCAEDGTAHSKKFARNMIREAANGLKGGQHGAE